MRALLTVLTTATDKSIYVDEAVASVPRSGDGIAIEHLVVHDGTAGFAARLAADYPWLRILAGPGRGATAAAALGMQAATGEFILVLNSDDRMVAGCVEALAAAANSRPEVEVWTGGTRIFEQRPGGSDRTMRLIEQRAATALTLENVLDDLPLLSARFVRKAVYQRIGPCDEKYSTCSDRELAIRMVLAGIEEAPLAVAVSELRMHEGSRTIRRPGAAVPDYLAQHIEIARRHMHRADLPDEVRRRFRGWHAREVLRKAFYELRCGQIGSALRTLGAAFSADWCWVRHAPSSLRARSLRRRGMPAARGWG